MINKVTINSTSKKWYQSKTLWAGVVSVMIGVLTTLQGNIESGVPITFMGFLMTTLRLITNTKLE